MAKNQLSPQELKQVAGVKADAKATVGSWLKSPALDFYAIAIIGSILITIGLVMVLSSSSVTNIAAGRSAYAGFISQGTFAVIGLGLLFLAMRTPIALYKNMLVAHFLLLAGLVLQMLVLVPGIGLEQGGNRNWIKVGSVSGQPSEFLKLALAVWLGAYLSRNRHRLRQPSVVLVAVLVIGVCLGSIIAGHDLGTMMMVAMLGAGALWVAGVPKRWFVVATVVAAIGVTTLVFTSPNRLARIGNWVSGECVGDSCWQADNGLMALAEGGWWGVGIGQSRQKWGRLPEADNDYIFAIIGEELGLIGTLSVVLLFAVLAVVLYRIMIKYRDPFVQITIAGITSWILAQAFVNMSVVTGLLPVLGVPLPFVSSGGSALVASMLALGLLLAFARSEPGAAEAINARAGRVKRTGTVRASNSSKKIKQQQKAKSYQ